MAAGNILLQANDSKIANIVFEEGASGNMSVTVPKEGGTLANESYVDTAINTVLGNVSTTELGYLDGVTSAIQTQIDTKQTAAQVTAAITAQKASSTVYGVAKISVSGSTLTITTI